MLNLHVVQVQYNGENKDIGFASFSRAVKFAKRAGVKTIIQMIYNYHGKENKKIIHNI